jgi:prepilin-type N-terminal cleavage/methylation domain-containing protein
MIDCTIKMPIRSAQANRSHGFTLIELAVVLLILGVLLAGILIPFTTQIELRRVAETQKTLVEIRDALIGFAAANGRLPCPAAAGGDGQESFVPGGNEINGNCSNFLNGFVPGAVLGIGPTDSAGYVLDAWNNRIRYAVSNDDKIPSGTAAPTPPARPNIDFTGLGTAPSSSGEMRNVGMPALKPNLRVCSTAPTSPAISCLLGRSLIDNAVAVVYSTGPNASRADPGGFRIDENANPNPNVDDNNRTFVSHDRAGENSPNGEFDDLVIWLSPNILYARMIAAGRLP